MLVEIKSVHTTWVNAVHIYILYMQKYKRGITRIN